MNYMYVLVATVEGRRIPLAMFDNRSRCEDAVSTELHDRLGTYNLRSTDCDLFAVEEWTCNSWLDTDTITTLTSYDKHGKLARHLVAPGVEGKTLKERRGARLLRLMEKKV